jgi:plastocyanin
MNKLLIPLILIILIIGGLAVFNKSNKSGTNLPSSSSLPTSTTSSTPSGQVNVTLTPSGFDPQTVTIAKGTKVIWINKSGQTATVNSDPHPIHTAYPPLNLGVFSDGSSLSLVFDQPGTYGYHNHLNPSEFGKIIVK